MSLKLLLQQVFRDDIRSSIKKNIGKYSLSIDRQTKIWVPVTLHSGAFKDAVDALNKITHTQMDLKIMKRQNLTGSYCVDLNFREISRGKVVVLTHTHEAGAKLLKRPQ